MQAREQKRVDKLSMPKTDLRNSIAGDDEADDESPTQFAAPKPGDKPPEAKATDLQLESSKDLDACNVAVKPHDGADGTKLTVDGLWA
jgi:hypothetical protein